MPLLLLLKPAAKRGLYAIMLTICVSVRVFVVLCVP